MANDSVEKIKLIISCVQLSPAEGPNPGHFLGRREAKSDYFVIFAHLKVSV